MALSFLRVWLPPTSPCCPLRERASTPKCQPCHASLRHGAKHGELHRWKVTEDRKQHILQYSLEMPDSLGVQPNMTNCQCLSMRFFIHLFHIMMTEVKQISENISPGLTGQINWEGVRGEKKKHLINTFEWIRQRSSWCPLAAGTLAGKWIQRKSVGSGCTVRCGCDCSSGQGQNEGIKKEQFSSVFLELSIY